MTNGQNVIFVTDSLNKLLIRKYAYFRNLDLVEVRYYVFEI